MTYGGGTVFHIARSSGLMPFSTAIRYSVWPWCTVAVAPYFGADTCCAGARDTGARITRVLPQPATSITTRAVANTRTLLLRGIAVKAALMHASLCTARLPHQIADAGGQQHHRRPPDRFDVPS